MSLTAIMLTLSCCSQAEVEARPLLYNNFMTVTADDTPVYNVVPGYEQLRKTLNDKLAEYNESNAVMDLVLFQQAMEHICRITRIISLPRGNAMLVGVGGSGKQSLARYALINVSCMLRCPMPNVLPWSQPNGRNTRISQCSKGLHVLHLSSMQALVTSCWLANGHQWMGLISFPAATQAGQFHLWI